MNFFIFKVASLLAWPGYLPITLFNKKPDNIE